jgi:hypothetical protein
MKPLMILLKREWLEWQRVIIGTILVITFLNLLMLLSVSRGSDFLHSELEKDGHILIEDVRFSDEDEEFDVDVRMNGNDVELSIDGDDTPRSVEQVLKKAALPIAFGLRLGMMGTFGFILFLSLFYFSDAIYKERADNSTLFYRSLPVNDHMLLGSKIAAGLIGVIGLTLFLSIEYLAFLRTAIWIMGEPFTSLASLVLNQISYLRLIWDWFGYLLFAAIHMAPLVGIGAPILLSISWAIIFQSAALLKTIGKFFWGFNQVIIDQWEMMEKGLDTDMAIYGNFWAYIFNVDTAISVLVSALLYYGIWHTYRKNIPTG